MRSEFLLWIPTSRRGLLSCCEQTEIKTCLVFSLVGIASSHALKHIWFYIVIPKIPLRMFYPHPITRGQEGSWWCNRSSNGTWSLVQLLEKPTLSDILVQAPSRIDDSLSASHFAKSQVSLSEVLRVRWLLGFLASMQDSPVSMATPLKTLRTSWRNVSSVRLLCSLSLFCFFSTIFSPEPFARLGLGMPTERHFLPDFQNFLVRVVRQSLHRFYKLSGKGFRQSCLNSLRFHDICDEGKSF